MKKLISILLMITLCASLAACGNEKESGSDKAANDTAINKENYQEETSEAEVKSQTAESTAVMENTTELSTETKIGSNILVVYFSATGNTKAIAESIADGLEADIYEIVPEESYTDADLDYNDDNSRTTLEMNDSSARPEISGTVDNFEQYDTVFLGYPIWWGEAPRILDTFVESYDFTGKTVIPFCTSASSGIGSSADILESLAGSGNWLDGQRFDGNESTDKVQEWASQFK